MAETRTKEEQRLWRHGEIGDASETCPLIRRLPETNYRSSVMPAPRRPRSVVLLAFSLLPCSIFLAIPAPYSLGVRAFAASPSPLLAPPPAAGPWPPAAFVGTGLGKKTARRRRLLLASHVGTSPNERGRSSATAEATAMKAHFTTEVSTQLPVPPPLQAPSAEPAVAKKKDDSSMSSAGDGAEEYEAVPKTLREAYRTFFLSTEHPGPPLVVAAIICLATWRSVGLSGNAPDISLLGDGVPFLSALAFWPFQEHFMHGKLLHSEFDWIGKQIHEKHHEKPYYHVSIDPTWLLLGWLLAAHALIRLALPGNLPSAISATVGYACAGLFYEWAHFIAHTMVRFKPGSYWQTIKSHHMRHHRIDSNYWLGFSIPSIDGLFGTNPNPKDVVAAANARRRLQQQ